VAAGIETSNELGNTQLVKIQSLDLTYDGLLPIYYY